jgi:hypothetical protein
VAAGLFVLVTVTQSAAQGQIRGAVTDEWGNGLAGALVLAERTSGGGTLETTSDEDGDFLFVGLSSGQWAFEFHLEGYQPVRQNMQIRASNSNRRIEMELPVVPTGESLFSEDVEYEAEGGTPNITFDEEGQFEFEDTNGEGEGTYGLIGLNGILIVREYDGPDETYSVNQPVVVTFADNERITMTWGEVTLSK